MRKLFQLTTLFIVFAAGCRSVLEAQEVSPKASSQDLGSADKIPSTTTVTKVSNATPENKNWIERTKRILEIGIAGLTNAEQKKELLKLRPVVAADDPRFVFAFVLVAMKEKEWASALKNTTEVLERHKDYLPARVANARLLLTQDKKLAAVAELELLAKGLDDTSSAIVSSDQLSFAARFLGLAVGFLEGPGKESIKATTLQALIAETDKISPAHQGPFSEARMAVMSEYETLVDKGEQALADLRQGKVEDAEDRRKELELQVAKTEAEAIAAKKQIESNWATTTTRWNVVWSNCQSLRQSAITWQSNRDQAARSIATLRQPRVDKNGNVDRNDESRYLAEQQRLNIRIADIDGRLGRLSADYNLAIQNGMAIEKQMNAIQVQAQQLGMTLAAMNGSFVQADQFIKAKEKSAKKIDPKLSGSKLRQARAFSTYDDFNFHKEQTLLADTLPKE